MFGEVDEYFLRQSGVTSEQIRRLSSVELIELAIARGRIFKFVLEELARRGSPGPNGAAEECLLRAYREGGSHGWLIAALLPSVATPRGYDLAREILLSGAGFQAESYATRAMIGIDRDRARLDLVQIICNPEIHVRVRRYAGDALKDIADVSMVPPVLDAVRCRRLGVARASAVLRPLDIPSAEVVGWLEDGDDAVARLGFSLGMRRSIIDRELARAMGDVLEANRIELSPTERESVEARIAYTTRSRRSVT